MIDLFGKWISSGQQSGGEKIEEPFNRPIPEDFINREAYLEWMEKDGALDEFLSHLKVEYNNFTAVVQEHDNWIDFLVSKGANGIMIHAEKYPGKLSNWHYLAEYLKERVLSWGYKLYSSEERSQGGIRPFVFRRHYLKPPVKNMLSQPVDQIFGNVTIELVSRGDTVEKLKFQILHYSDRSYLEPRDIEELYHSVFDKN